MNITFKIHTSLETDENSKDFSTLREDMALHTDYLLYMFHLTLQGSDGFERGPVLPFGAQGTK